MYDIVGIGTMLIDFTPHGVSNNGNTLYERNPGGSVANFLVAAARQGSKCAFIGKLGNDMFGRFLKKTLEDDHIETAGVVMCEEKLTSGAFVQLDDKGEREFVFYRKGMADSSLLEQEVRYDILDHTRTLHLTSFMLAGDEAYHTVLKILDYVAEKDLMVTIDVNRRPNIWDDKELGMERIKRIIERTDILKVSKEELDWLTGGGDSWEKSAEKLTKKGPKLIIVTAGSNGSNYYYAGHSGHVDSYPVTPVDTTGAGDCCFGVFMSRFLQAGMTTETMNDQVILSCLDDANWASAQCVSCYGGIPSMPHALCAQRT